MQKVVQTHQVQDKCTSLPLLTSFLPRELVLRTTFSNFVWSSFFCVQHYPFLMHLVGRAAPGHWRNQSLEGREVHQGYAVCRPAGAWQSAAAVEPPCVSLEPSGGLWSPLSLWTPENCDQCLMLTPTETTT